VNQTPTAPALSALTDVSISSPSSSQVLLYGGSNWANTTLALTKLSNVTITSPASKQALMYNGTAWINQAPTMPMLSGVSLSSPVAGQLLGYNGTNWVNQNKPAKTLASVGDVQISSPTDKQALVYNATSGKWANGSILPSSTGNAPTFAYLKLTPNSSAPATCSSTITGAIALNHLAQFCVCNGTAWYDDVSGAACSW
jgi:hypothetical protein